MTATSTRIQSPPNANHVLALAENLWDFGGPASVDQFLRAISVLSENVARANLTAIADNEIEQAHLAARTLRAQGAIHAAVVVSSVNLLAASQLRLPEWTEWSMGVLCSCCEAGLGQPESEMLLAFVDNLRAHCDFDYDPHPKLGLCTLTANLCEIVAASAKSAQRRELLERAVAELRMAYLLAEAIPAPPEQVAVIRMSLGRDLLSLFELGGNAAPEMVQESLEHLARSLDYFLGIPAKTMAAALIEQQMARACRAAATNMHVLLEEPALPADKRRERTLLCKRNVRSTVAHLHAAVKRVPHDDPRRDVMMALLLDELSEDLQSLARYVAPHSRRLLRIARSYSQEAAAIWEATKSRDRCLSSHLEATYISQKLLTNHADGDYEEVVRSFQEAVDRAADLRDPWLIWRSASLFGNFVVGGAHGRAITEEDWSQAHRLFEQARRNLAGCADITGMSKAHVYMLRKSTIWFWEHAVRAAARSGNLDAIPRILETQSVLSSLDRSSLPSDERLSWNALSELLPHDRAALVYVLQGSNSLQAVVIHCDQPSQDDYIRMDASWEAVRQVVDPWIAANERLRVPGANEHEFEVCMEACMQSLQSMLRSLYSLIWEKIDARLQAIGATQVFLVRGRGLTILPLHAIQRDDGTALLDRYAISYLKSGSTMGDSKCSRPADSKFLAVANPNNQLPFTEPEVRMAGSHFSWLHRTILTRGRARARSVKAALSRADYLHFACHGRYDIELKGVLTTGFGQLALADGRLELDELQLLRLPRRPIVILSACETGRSNWRDLESLGIADYFLSSGARAVIATLWPVNDVATALLVGRFYDQIDRGDNLSEALRSAQRWLRDLNAASIRNALAQPAFVRSISIKARRVAESCLKSQFPFAHPFYWAPFYLATAAAHDSQT